MSKPAGDTASVGSAAASFGLASSASPSVINIDPELRKCLAEVDTLLAIHVAAWMKKRGRSLRPKLSDEQRKQLEECFELMDADGSGAIDADELGAAFKLLGLAVSKADIAQMLAEVDEDGSGEMEYPEFIEIMTSTLAKLADKKEEEGAGGSQVPFALLATAYRRKRIIEGLISGDKDVMAQVTSIAEQAARRAADDAQRQLQLLHQQAQARQRHSNLPSTVSSPKASLDAGRHSIFRPNAASSNGRNSIDSSDRTAGVDTAAAAAAAAVAAAGEARAAQVTAQAGVSSGLLRALQHIKSFCSSHSGSARSSPGSSAASSKRTSLEVPAVLVRPIVPAPVAPAASGQGVSGSSQEAEEDLVDLPVEAIAGVLDLEEQRQLISLLRAKTRKRLEALAVAAAAAGQPGSSCSNSRWPSVGGYLRSTGNSSSGALSSSGSGSGSTAAGSSSGAAQGPVGSGSTPPASAVDLEGLVGAKQRLTSKLMLKLLTQNVEAPKFALTSTVQRSSASGSNGNGNSSSNSPTPSLPGLYPRGCRSATCSPSPYKQPSLTAVDAAGSANSSPWNQQQQQQRKASGGLLPTAGDAGAAGQLSSSSGPLAASSGAGRRGINFGDAQVYEYDSQKGSSSRHGSSTGGSSSAGRVSEGSGGAGHSLSAMHRSKSLGVLSQDVLGHFCQPSAAPTAPAAGIIRAGSGRKPLAGSNTPFRSPSSRSTFNNNSSSGGSEKHRAPSRAKSTSALRSRATAAALQQLGSGCALSVAPKLEQQQQQQQWMPLPQLPRAAGCLHAAPCHQRSKSSSPICANSVVLSGSGSAVVSAKQGTLLGGQGSLPSVAGGVVARQPSGSLQSKRLL